MRKATHYKVSGVVETKPSDLPEGLAVEEVEVTLPRLSIDIVPIHGGSGIQVAEYDLDDTTFPSPGVMLSNKGIYDGEQIRKLRDFLNVVLDETPKMRVLKDVDGDVWFELEPNLFTLGTREDDPEALKKAQRKLALRTGYHSRSLEYVLDHEYFGPAVFIENTWE
jgi:hypothetical protein